MNREPKTVTLRFRCTQEMAQAVYARAAAERREVPSFLRIIIEDWLAAQKSLLTLKEKPVPYRIKR